MGRRKRRRRRITIPMFLCCFDTHFDTDDWHIYNSPAFSGRELRHLPVKICVSNEALLRLSIIVDEGQHKEMPKDGDSQLGGVRLICLRSCGFQIFGKVGGTETFAGNSTQHVMLLVDSYLTFSQEYMMPPSVAPQLPLASKHEPGVVDETYFDTAEFEALEGLGWKRILGCV